MATSGSSVTGWPASDAQTVEVLKPILAQAFTLSDAQLELAISQPAPLPPNYKLFDQVIELRTPRIFLDPPVARAATGADTNAQPLVTYLANLLSAGTNRTPYSMVTAAGAPWTPLDMRDDEIVANEWLAQDLQVKPGDEISLVYFDPESGARLVERTNTFRLRSVVPLDPPWTDRTLMPQFPGIEKAESTRDWDAGFPLVHKIRSKDEDYWKQYRGTPKAFVTLAAGKKMWANRFGELTAIRFPVPTNVVGTRSTASQASPQNGDAVERVPTSPEEYRAALEKKILASLKPEEVGLRFEPVREQALKAAEQSQPFGQLFLGFSFFLIVAALLLMALLFQLGLEQRAPEVGTLLALGFSPKQVRKLLLLEGGALAFIGGLLGALAGIAYARAMLRGLVTIWRDAVGATTLSFHMTAETLAIGVLASVIVSVLTIWMTMRKFVRRPARELLAGEVQSPTAKAQSRGAIIAGAALVAALVVLGWILSKGETANAGAFFGAGALLLIAGIAVVSASLTKWMRQSKARSASPRKAAGLTLTALGVRGCARRRKRSLATVAMLACGSFLILAIGVFRLDANRDAWKRNSGTGGFALVGETTMPVVHDLNAKSGREYFGLSEADLAGVSFVPMRVREGDEASCLNLNRAQRPRLLGVKPEMLEGRFTFSKGAGWNSLRSSRRKEAQTSKAESNQGLLTSAATSQNEIAAIGDANSIQWALGKKVGDTLDYVDERSQPFKVRIVGAVANSILQGSLIIDEGEFVKRFPSESGYRMFLIDAPSNSVSQISATLSRAFQDVGLELTLAAQRLDQFNAVQNTYLGTFQILGGLGLLLGSAGLGVVVMRNALERRGELALLLATGFRRPTLQWLVLSEHAALLGLGIAVGIISAAVAVLPALLSRAAQLPYLSLSLTVVAVLLNGALWTWVATRLALRGDLLKALRNE
jgi:ABC-type antimicrobial peptide transport system permease subunit